MCCPQKLSVQLLSVDFQQDHRMLKDAWDGAAGNPDWGNTGSLYAHHDWLPLAAGKDPNPVSYSMVHNLQADHADPVASSFSKGGAPRYDKANRSQMQVELRLKIMPDCACPEKCQLYGIGQERFSDRTIIFSSGWIV